MGKITLFGLLLILVISVTATISLVDPPPVAQTTTEEKKTSTPISKESDSSSSSESSDDGGKSSSSSSSSSSEESDETIDDREKMLCHVLVRATHDLHISQSKSKDQIQIYLNTDCENIGNADLVRQCHRMVSERGEQIYKHLINGMKTSDICETIEDDIEPIVENQRPAECSNGSGDKCQCCVKHVEKRKMRFRFIVKQMAKKRMQMCSKSPRPERCRQWIRQKEQRVLRKIDRICPHMVCKHLGYCGTRMENQQTIQIAAADGSPSLALELLDQRLEQHFNTSICQQFEQLEALCIHTAASTDGSRLTNMYMAIVHQDTKIIENQLRKEAQSIQTTVQENVCQTCKNVIQSGKDFYIQSLETVRNALENICNACKAKEKCVQFFDKSVNMVKDYVNAIDPNQICSTVRLCSSLPSIDVVLPTNEKKPCDTCVQRFQSRKDAAINTIEHLSTSFTHLCTSVGIAQCEQLVSEMITQARQFINGLDLAETCQAMGLCGSDAVHHVNEYEKAFVDEMNKNVCPLMSPFERLCQQIAQGNTEDIPMVMFNATDLDDFLTSCDRETSEKNGLVATNNECPSDKKCQCCIERVMQRKKCAKMRVEKYIAHMMELCQKCPARQQCEQYWQKKKQCWEAMIDQICPKKVCIRLGFCTKVDVTMMCAHMGPFKQVCEQALNGLTQVIQTNSEQVRTHLPSPLIVQEALKDKQQVVDKIALT